MVQFLAGINSEQRVFLEKGGNAFIEKIHQTIIHNTHYIGCDLSQVESIDVNALSAFYEKAKYSAMDWTKRISPGEQQRYYNEAIPHCREMAHITAATLATLVTNSESVGYAASTQCKWLWIINFANLVRVIN